MSELLTIHAFGGLAFEVDGQPVTGFVSGKAGALLLYLACTRRPHAREVLAEMFWEGRSQAQSLSNLRVVLSNLRRIVGSFVTITRAMVAINPSDNVWVDVVEFEALLNKADSQATASIEKALTLYRGDFLEGVYVDSRFFEDWSLLEREQLRFRAIETLDTLVHQHELHGAYSDGLRCAMQLLRLDPLREKTHRQMMRLFAYSGQRAAALVQYETCCRLLDEELGIEPITETTRLYEQIRAGEPGVVVQVQAAITHGPVQTNNLPVQSTSFIGRETEIADVTRLLAAPDCRLLSLLGPGGIGKTRLALAVADRIHNNFAQGVCFVDLVALNAPEMLVSAMATALGIQTRQGFTVQNQQLLDHLRNRELLLVLDNFEHLRAGVDVIDAILSGAPRVKILVTTRATLNLSWEWRYDVTGLAIPNGWTGENVQTYDAIQLFIERARRVLPDFRFADYQADVVQVCRFVEGLPLGIELAAAWLRMMPLPDIITRLIDLETALSDVAARHRSLRALFDHTWSDLPTRERTALASLTVFRGGFTQEAAECVVGITLPLLATLVSKSLLRVEHRTGRFTIHPLLYDYFAAKLAQHENGESLSRRHADYFVEQAERCEVQLFARNVSTWQAWVRTERDNLRAALNWLLDHIQAELSMRLVAALHGSWVCEDLAAEMIAWAERALDLSDDLPPALMARVLIVAARHHAFAGNFEVGEALSRRAVAINREWGTKPDLAYSLWCWGLCLNTNPEASLARFEEALALARELELDGWSGIALYSIGGINYQIGDYDRARAAYEDAVEAYFKVGDEENGAYALVDLGVLEQQQGNSARAESLSRQGLALLWKHGAAQDAAMTLALLAGPVNANGNPEQAARLLGASEVLTETMGSSFPAFAHQAIERYKADIQVQLAPDVFEMCRVEGRAMSLEEAIMAIDKNE